MFSLDSAGGSIPDKYTAGGSGSPYAVGVLEDRYKEGMSVEEGIDLGIRALETAMGRDSASGNGANIAVITADGFRSLDKDEIDSRLKKMGK